MARILIMLPHVSHWRTPNSETGRNRLNGPDDFVPLHLCWTVSRGPGKDQQNGTCYHKSDRRLRGDVTQSFILIEGRASSLHRSFLQSRSANVPGKDNVSPAIVPIPSGILLTAPRRCPRKLRGCVDYSVRPQLWSNDLRATCGSRKARRLKNGDKKLDRASEDLSNVPLFIGPSGQGRFCYSI